MRRKNVYIVKSKLTGVICQFVGLKRNISKNWDIILCRGRKLTLNCGFHTGSDLTGYTRFK